MGAYYSISEGADWQYVRFTKQMDQVLLPQGDGTFELVMAVSDTETTALPGPADHCLRPKKAGNQPKPMRSMMDGRRIVPTTYSYRIQ